MLYLDPKENPGALDFFGVKSEDSPMVVVHAPKANGKYSSGTIEVSKVVSWVADFKAGKIEKIVKSEEIPASQDEPVTVVVGKSFETVVKSGKNVFIEFYAPWCASLHYAVLEILYQLYLFQPYCPWVWRSISICMSSPNLYILMQVWPLQAPGACVDRVGYEVQGCREFDDRQDGCYCKRRA